jgi:hypothetical protein
MLRTIFTIIVVCLIVGCATTGGLLRLEPGMSKSKVINILGEPDVARGSMINKYDQIIEVWEYNLRKKAPGAQGINIDTVPATYWLYFVESRLVQWGEAGDWKQEADRIYEMRFR